MPAATLLPFVRKEGSDADLATGARGTVLVVEDNAFVAGVMMRILERRGRCVIRASDGAECVRVFAENEAGIALVILDCRLPDTDGITLCQQLRARSPGLRVLLTSGHNYAGPRALAGGPTAFLGKPFLPAQLEQHIECLLGATA